MINTVLYPIIWLYRVVILGAYQITGSLGFSLVVLSFFGAVLTWLFGKLFARYPAREKELQTIFAPQLDRIRRESSGEEQHKRISALYKRYSYHPLYALRSAIPVFIQLPFLFAAYRMISSLDILQGQSLWIIRDLSAPDQLLWKINVLPFIMTAVNAWAAFITPDFKLKDKVQALIIAAIFLVLLYSAPSALLIYWTMINLIFLVRTWSTTRHEVKHLPARAKDKTRLKNSLISFLPGVKLYFGFLCLFYVYQAIALEKGYLFKSFLKFIPFLMASAAFWVLQLYEVLSKFKQNIRSQLALICVSISVMPFILLLINGIVGLVSVDVSARTLAHASAYWLGAMAFIIGLIVPRQSEPSQRWSKMQGILLIIIMSLIPAAHFAKVNTDYLMGMYHLVFFISIFLIAVVNYIVARISFSHRSGDSLLYKSTAIFTFLLIVLPLIRFSLRATSKVDIDFWVIFFVTMALSYLIKSRESFRRTIQLSGIMLLVFFVSYGYSLVSENAHRPRGKVLSDEFRSISFKDHPNIYLFVYDGMPNERVFREQNLPFDRLKSILDKYDFKLYDDTYTLGAASLSSIGKMLDFTDRDVKAPEGREIYSGNSLANLILRNNGYSSHFLIDNSCTGYNAILYSHLYDEIFPPRTASATKSDYYLVLMRGILQGEMRYNTRGLIAQDDSDIQARKLEIIKQQLPQAFIINHFHYPGHTQNSGKCLPNEKELWAAKLTIALDQMEIDFQTLREYDPDAIVVAFGDHGSYLSGDCFDLSAWKKEEITPDLVWDRIGTMVAISWPDTAKAAKYDREIVTNQDILPVIFAYMADDPALLDYCPDNVFWGLQTTTRSALGFDKGEILR